MLFEFVFEVVATHLLYMHLFEKERFCGKISNSDFIEIFWEVAPCRTQRGYVPSNIVSYRLETENRIQVFRKSRISFIFRSLCLDTGAVRSGSIHNSTAGRWCW